MSTIVASSYMPALGTGRSARTYGIVRALAAQGSVELVHLRFGAEAPDAAYARLPNVSLRAVGATPKPTRAAAYAVARAAGVPDPVARGASPALARVVTRLAAEAGRVVADDPLAAVALWPLAGRRPVVYSAHNLESRFRADLDTGWGSRERLERFERRLLERVDEAWMPSRADLDGARRLAPGARLRYAPNVVDVAAIAATEPRSEAREVLFVADLTYAPNRDALRFLLDAVAPLVWRAVPDARISVVGRGLEDPPSADPRVRFHGFVEDLGARYRSASCAIVPLLVGGGSPLKFVEALAYGVPVVATPRAAAGLDVAPGEHYLEGEDAPGLAAAVVEAFDPGRARQVGAAGRALAEREYSIESLERRLAGEAR